MDKLRKLSFRKKRNHIPESSKPHQWQEDEKKVREGSCSFQVRYLGCVEVFESRGMQVCEEAVKALKANDHCMLFQVSEGVVLQKKSRSVWQRMSLRMSSRRKGKDDRVNTPQCKGKYQRAILYVSGDALRVVDEISKGLIVDQTIEKVSFCAPDRAHEKGFAYICRDGTSRRWMCHGFLALKESGERLSHAVGCAFGLCLEKKQKRDKDASNVQVTYNEKGTSFTRTGSFKQTTLTERLEDPQAALIAEPVPEKNIQNPHAVQRPHASQDMLIRQGSFKGFQKLSQKSSPFKRQHSLRLEDLPSTLERQGGDTNYPNGFGVHTIPEASPSKEEAEASIADMCKQISSGLTMNEDDPYLASLPLKTTPTTVNHMTTKANIYQQQSNSKSVQLPEPIRHPNPWQKEEGKPDGETWLQTVSTNPFKTPNVVNQHNRSQSVDTAHTSVFGHQATVPNNTGFDPFDAAWVGAKPRGPPPAPVAPTNPFAVEMGNAQKTFEVKL